MKAAISSKENIAELPSTITKKNMHLFSKEIQDFFEVAKDKDILLPKRYFRAQKSMLAKKLTNLYTAQPDLSTRMVIISILQELPDFLPPDNLLSITKYLIEEWDKLQKQKLPTK